MTISLKARLNKKHYTAFSLVEILVVLGLFSSIATLSLGALFNTQAINGALQETQTILDNINLSTQTVTRDIRFGSDFYCATSAPTSTITTLRKNCSYDPTGISGGGSVLIFKSGDFSNALDRVAYYVKNGVLYKDEWPFSGGTTTLRMTTGDVSIQSLVFFVDGANTSDGSSDEGLLFDYKQPIVTMLLSGTTKPAKSSVRPVTFSVQVNVSPRELDTR